MQNAYVRIQSVLRKAGEQDLSAAAAYKKLEPAERDLIAQLFAFPALIVEAAEAYDPSSVANFSYDLAKNYHRFYHDYSILKADTEAAKAFRIKLSKAVAHSLKLALELLGIEVPSRM